LLLLVSGFYGFGCLLYHAAHEKGTAHEFNSEEAREAGRKGGQSGGKGRSEDDDESSSSTRGGTSEQHAKAGSQSHKNR